MIYNIGFLRGILQGAKGLKEEYTFLDLYLMGYTIAYPDPDPRTGFKGYAWVSGGCTDVRYLGAAWKSLPSGQLKSICFNKKKR